MQDKRRWLPSWQRIELVQLCLSSCGVIAVDGTKVAANAAVQAMRGDERIAREILAEADAVDAEEDERFGEARGDELPAELRTAQGRRGWLREAKCRLNERRAEDARPIQRSRPDRLKEARRRLEEEHQVECRANAAMRPTAHTPRTALAGPAPARGRAGAGPPAG